MGKKLDLTGRVYGRLTVIRESGKDKHGAVLWVCRCVCGNEIIVRGSSLTKGNTQSCGCLRHENGNTGSDCNFFRHGLTKHPLYIVWSCMRLRCGIIKGANDYVLKGYKERGITICDEWRDDFKAFYDWAIANGWKKGLQLDRKDNNKGYSPDNCHFVTRSRNCRNRRNTLKLKSGEPLIDYLERYNVPIYNKRDNHLSGIADHYRISLKETGYIQGFLFPLNAEPY